MHAAVRDWVRAYAVGHYPIVLEVGSRDINGGVRDLISAVFYHGIDLYDGPGVDHVGDARKLEGRYDLVLCLETAEHSDDPQGLIDTLGRLCAPGGLVVFTAAGEGREPHSAFDGGPLQPGEHYQNLTGEHATVAWGETIAFEHKDTDFRIVWRRYG